MTIIDNKNKTPKESNDLNTARSMKVFNCCFIIIMLDVIYFFIYVYPLCLGISILSFKNGFVHLLLVVVISYQSDNGALFAGNKFGRIQFGYPVTPNKTIEGVWGAIILG